MRAIASLLLRPGSSRVRAVEGAHSLHEEAYDNLNGCIMGAPETCSVQAWQGEYRI